MRGYRVLPEPLSQMMRHALGQPPRVHENQRGAVLVDELPRSGRKSRPTFRSWRPAPSSLARHFNSEVESRGGGRRLTMTGSGRSLPARNCATSSMGFCVAERPMRTGGRSTKRFQPFERKRQMRAALVVRHGMNLIDDHRFNCSQDVAALFGGQQNVQRFGRRDQNVRRMRQHRAALVHQRVARAHSDTDFRHQQSALAGHLQDLTERYFKVFLNVVAERLQRRNVKDSVSSCKFAGQRLAHQAIDASQESRQRLA